MYVVDHHFLTNFFTLFKKDYGKQLNMELTERELLVQQLNFDWNSSNKNPHCFHVNSQETYQPSYDKQRPRTMDDLLTQSNFLSNYLSQPNVVELQNKERVDKNICSSCNHQNKPVNDFNLSKLFDCVLAPSIVDYNKLLTRIDNILNHFTTLHNQHHDYIMNIKEELNTFRETMTNQINMHEKALEKRVEEILARSLEANREKYQNFIKDEISKQSSFILSQINESFNTLVDRIPQDKYIQINSLNQLFSNEITKETSEHRYSFEHVYDPSQNVINMEDVIIHSGNMDGSDLTSYSTDMQEKEIVPTSSTNSIIDVVKSEFADNSARHVAQLNKMSLENIIL
ncbi:hypothetical protein RhiirC2_844996 [Rhizophagus irregularis]|uniref:Uncharacterized protein n=1 Tax=Rhizophagus irregularis TaxID=588596 RepID=A0A2N1NS36_9GLOM|nr:hypothetical protein RhiirC2_844996 [Rhizophagus irregularis]